MKKLFLILVVLGSLSAFAQSAFDGTWRLNPQSAQFKARETFQLQNGVWRCDTCVPKISVKADNKPQTVTGSPYYDTITVREVNDHEVEITETKNGKVVQTNKLTASDDGKTLLTEFTFTSEGGQQGNGSGIYEREASGPTGTNKVSGTWKPSKFKSASDSVLSFTLKTTADGLTMNDGTGDSYTAKFDGKDYPYKGDPGTTSVVLKKIDANTIEETDKRNGKVMTVARMTVAKDGKTMTMTVEDKLHNSTVNWTAEKR
jgi:hypothetical protein